MSDFVRKQKEPKQEKSASVMVDSQIDQLGDQGIGVALWQSLIAHAKQQVLLEVVNSDLALEEVAAAMEADQVEKIQAWLVEKTLLKVDEKRMVELSAESEESRFEVRVVAPFVLCRQLG